MPSEVDPRHGRAAFLLALAGICLLAISLRAPGLRWLQDPSVTPFPVFDFHPDVMRLVRPTDDFREIKGWRGYPLGLTTQLYLVRNLLEAFGLHFSPVLLIRAISLSYGVLTIVLTGVVARALSASSRVGLLAALFLALAPLHVINSHFGTADSALLFFLYLSMFFGWRSLRHHRDLDFLLFVASVGVTLAVKFFVPLLLPLAIVVWHQERRVEKALQAALILAGSFSVANFFNYTPWDLSALLEMIREENVSVVGGLTPPKQLGLYLWETVRALGLGVWVFFVIGLAVALGKFWRRRPTLDSLDPAALYSMTKSPYIVPVSALSLHFASLVVAGYHAPRHLLPFLPLMCFVGAIGLSRVSSRMRSSKVAIGGILLVLVTYQIYNAVGTEARYTHDIRYMLAAKVADVTSPGDEVVTFHGYSLVRGATIAPGREDPDSGISSQFFVTCGFRPPDDPAVFHAYRQELRPVFYRDLFDGQLGYHLIFEVSRDDFTLEQRLAAKGLLPSMGMFTPSQCVLFARDDVVAEL